MAYEGSHTPLTTFATWMNVQEILDGRSISNVHGNRHEFTYTGLMTCGHCGCAMTAEIKKGRYIYYHCSKFKARCPEPYVREEALDLMFAAQLRKLRLDDDVFRMIGQAIRESRANEIRERDDGVTKIRAEADRLQHRLDTLYLDKIEGRVTSEFHDRVAEERDRCVRDLESLSFAEDDVIDDGVALVDFARTAHHRFETLPLSSKRRALNLVLSNCSFAGGEVATTFRKPFDLLQKIASPDGGDTPPEGGLHPKVWKWLPE